MVDICHFQPLLLSQPPKCLQHGHTTQFPHPCSLGILISLNSLDIFLIPSPPVLNPNPLKTNCTKTKRQNKREKLHPPVPAFRDQLIACFLGPRQHEQRQPPRVSECGKSIQHQTQHQTCLLFSDEISCSPGWP